MASILVVEDEPLLSRELKRFLEGLGHQVRLAADGAGALAPTDGEPDLALLDLRLPDANGIDVLQQLREQNPDLAIVLMTAYGSVQDAVEAMRCGAADYLQKPLDLDELGLLIERLLSRQQQQRELDYLRSQRRVMPEGLIGEDSRLVAVFAQVERLAAAKLAPGERPSILLTGETGTGKGMVAHAVHEVLGGGPFVEVNCTAIPASLVEAELFGHERGTFTDAKTARSGLFEAADGGTIFLDEIGELAPGIQSKFLKVIEEKRIRRLGSARDRTVNVQVIAATNVDLDAAAKAGEFRSDLLHRLRVLSFEIPPLRERAPDLPALASHFAAQLGQQYHRRAMRIDAQAIGLLEDYEWPGNVRELRNVLERAVLLAAGDELGAVDIEPLIRPSTGGGRDLLWLTLPAEGIQLEGLERDLIRQALARTSGNRTRAAALLGLSRDTLRYRIEKYRLADDS